MKLPINITVCVLLLLLDKSSSLSFEQQDKVIPHTERLNEYTSREERLNGDYSHDEDLTGQSIVFNDNKSSNGEVIIIENSAASPQDTPNKQVSSETRQRDSKSYLLRPFEKLEVEYVKDKSTYHHKSYSDHNVIKNEHSSYYDIPREGVDSRNVVFAQSRLTRRQLNPVIVNFLGRPALEGFQLGDNNQWNFDSISDDNRRSGGDSNISHGVQNDNLSQGTSGVKTHNRIQSFSFPLQRNIVPVHTPETHLNHSGNTINKGITHNSEPAAFLVPPPIRILEGAASRTLFVSPDKLSPFPKQVQSASQSASSAPSLLSPPPPLQSLSPIPLHRLGSSVTQNAFPPSPQRIFPPAPLSESLPTSSSLSNNAASSGLQSHLTTFQTLPVSISQQHHSQNSQTYQGANVPNSFAIVSGLTPPKYGLMSQPMANQDDDDDAEYDDRSKEHDCNSDGDCIMNQFIDDDEADDNENAEDDIKFINSDDYDDDINDENDIDDDINDYDDDNDSETEGSDNENTKLSLFFAPPSAAPAQRLAPAPPVTLEPFTSKPVLRITPSPTSVRGIQQPLPPVPAEPKILEQTSESPNLYQFNYEVYNKENHYGHQEQRENNRVTGVYHVILPDGRRQVVRYYADETGYHPTITYEKVNDIDPRSLSLESSVDFSSPRHSRNSNYPGKESDPGTSKPLRVSVTHNNLLRGSVPPKYQALTSGHPPVHSTMENCPNCSKALMNVSATNASPKSKENSVVNLANVYSPSRRTNAFFQNGPISREERILSAKSSDLRFRRSLRISPVVVNLHSGR